MTITATTLVRHSKRKIRTPCVSCGESYLYYAHDTSKALPWENGCSDCTERVGFDVRGPLVLTNADGTLHECSNPGGTDGPDSKRGSEAEKSAPKNQEPKVKQDVFTAIDALRVLFNSNTVSEDQVRDIVRQEVSSARVPTRTVVVRDKQSKEVEGSTHRQLADVVNALLVGEHVMMVGPAGTGKSTIAEQAAEALDLPSYSLSLSPQTPASAIIGYMQAAGEYVGTLFREAYEKGGVFHFDEVDNSHPSVLAVINAALANGAMAFPDGMVKRHPDFRCVASANTYGRGATRLYVGRQAMDAATLDRFTVITIEIDEALEHALCQRETSNEQRVNDVLTYVRKLRKRAEEHGLTVVLSPRASVGMVRLLEAGFTWEAAVDARIRRGLDDATWAKLTGRA